MIETTILGNRLRYVVVENTAWKKRQFPWAVLDEQESAASTLRKKVAFTTTERRAEQLAQRLNEVGYIEDCE